MDNEQQNKMMEEICKICKKYNVTHIVFAGQTEGDNGMFGFMEPNKTPWQVTDFARITENAARVYQTCRERLYTMLDQIAKK